MSAWSGSLHCSQMAAFSLLLHVVQRKSLLSVPSLKRPLVPSGELHNLITSSETSCLSKAPFPNNITLGQYYSFNTWILGKHNSFHSQEGVWEKRGYTKNIQKFIRQSLASYSKGYPFPGNKPCTLKKHKRITASSLDLEVTGAGHLLLVDVDCQW